MDGVVIGGFGTCYWVSAVKPVSKHQLFFLISLGMTLSAGSEVVTVILLPFFSILMHCARWSFRYQPVVQYLEGEAGTLHCDIFISETLLRKLNFPTEELKLYPTVANRGLLAPPDLGGVYFT